MGKRSKHGPEATPDAVVITVADPTDPIAGESLPASVGDVISAVAAAVVPAARTAGPDKFGVEFGVRQRPDGSAELTDGTAGATFRVFMEWTGRADG